MIARSSGSKNFLQSFLLYKEYQLEGRPPPFAGVEFKPPNVHATISENMTLLAEDDHLRREFRLKAADKANFDR